MNLKLAIPIRTSGVYNFWNSKRYVSDDKGLITRTCIKSLATSIAAAKNITYNISVHDDNSDEYTLNSIHESFHEHGLKYELFHTQPQGNFISQYEWTVLQEFDYLYNVEDDYLHYPAAIYDMIDMVDYMKRFQPYDYAIYPFNNPHRYQSFAALYPSYIVKGPHQYWRSLLHSTHTFLISKKCFVDNIDIMKDQAYTWHIDAAVEDESINLVWKKQDTMLFCPMQSLAFHMTDVTQKPDFDDWQTLWSYYETR